MKKEENNEEKALRDLLNGAENSFKVPDGYFEMLSSKIMDKIESQPDFNKSSQTNPFSVPEGYFEKLPVLIADRISTSSKPSIPSFIASLKRPRIAIPIGLASFTLIALVVIFSQKKLTLQPEKEFTYDELENSSYFDSFDEDLLIGMIPNQDIESADDSLEQYLIDNNIEISQLENEL